MTMTMISKMITKRKRASYPHIVPCVIRPSNQLHHQQRALPRPHRQRQRLQRRARTHKASVSQVFRQHMAMVQDQIIILNLFRNRIVRVQLINSSSNNIDYPAMVFNSGNHSTAPILTTTVAVPRNFICSKKQRMRHQHRPHSSNSRRYVALKMVNLIWNLAAAVRRQRRRHHRPRRCLRKTV